MECMKLLQLVLYTSRMYSKSRTIPFFEGATIYVQDGDVVKAGDELADKFLFEGES